jgi:hypothetical protein
MGVRRGWERSSNRTSDRIVARWQYGRRGNAELRHVRPQQNTGRLFVETRQPLAPLQDRKNHKPRLFRSNQRRVAPSRRLERATLQL